MEGNKTKKRVRIVFSYVGMVVVILLIVGVLASPEISNYFKNRDLPSESNLKQIAIKKFDEYKVNPVDNDPQRTTFEELGNTKFPYSINYSHLIDSSHIDEKLYLYSQTREDWILVSDTTRASDGKGLSETSDWNLLTQ